MSVKLRYFLSCVVLMYIVETVLSRSTTLQGTLLCPDQNFCGPESTCCETKYSSYGCCPLYQANCCDNMKTCCPMGMRCLDHPPYCSNFTVYGTKTRRSVHESKDVATVPDKIQDFNIHAVPIMEFSGFVTESNRVGNSTKTCKLDPKGSCDEDQNCCYDKSPAFVIGNGTDTFAGCCKGTCCNDFASGKYFGCCPVTNAKCCSDKIHCCPDGYHCSSSGDNCIEDEVLHRIIEPALKPIHTELDPLVPSVEREHDDVSKFVRYRNAANLISRDQKIVPCPNNSSFCQDSYTCCPGENGKHLCCPHKNAECCSDKKHCCAHGKTCDLLNNICS